MECIACKTKMVCVNDVNDIETRIDFVVCPKCKSRANIVYGKQGKHIQEVNWIRGE